MILSYTFIDALRKCPRRAQHKHVLKDVPRIDTPALVQGRRVHEALEARLKTKAPLPNELKPLEPALAALAARNPHVEAKMGMTATGRGTGFLSGDVWLRGVVYIAVVRGGTALLLDWKTGKRREDPLELEIFATLLHANNSDLTRFVGRYVWLKDKALGEQHELDPRKGLRAAQKADMEVKEHTEHGGEWPACPGPLCAWCEVRSCKHNPSKD